MKKILIALLIGLILTGCSVNNSNPVEDKDTADVVEINEVEAEKENSTDEEIKEIEIPDTGLSLQIPDTWNSSKYKIHKDDYSISVDYTGEKELVFFGVTVNGKTGSEIPEVGLKSQIITVDDWVMTISYGYELAYAQLDEVVNSNPSEYYDMADSVQKIISSIKIVDEAKLESWINKRAEKKSVSEQTTYTPAAEGQTEYKKYTDFLGRNDEVQKFIKDDIDLDGKQEIVIAFNDNFGLKIFVLREDDEEIQNVGKIESRGYGISNVELIKLQGDNKKYIKTNLTNWANLSGFELYDVDKNTIRQIIYSASATGAGDDHLIDFDEDGYYDGFVQNRFSYDVFYYYVSRYYEWNGQDFKLVSTSINLDSYPEKPEAVVSQFLKLSILNNYEEKCDELSKRLSELNNSNKKLTFEKEYAWTEALQLENIVFNVNENGNSTIVSVTMQDEVMEFILTKENGKWHISDFRNANIINNAS